MHKTLSGFYKNVLGDRKRPKRDIISCNKRKNSYHVDIKVNFAPYLFNKGETPPKKIKIPHFIIQYIFEAGHISCAGRKFKKK